LLDQKGTKLNGIVKLPKNKDSKDFDAEAKDQQKPSDNRSNIFVNLPSLKKSYLGNSPGTSVPKALSIDNEKDKPSIYERYRYLVRSPNANKDRVMNYILMSIRGLHYSVNSLKEPSKKFINSRKLKVKEHAISKTWTEP
jgi:hypothetical protein